MMSSDDDDDDMEPRLKVVENYYFVDDDDAPVSFDVLPFQINAAEEVPSFKTDVYLRGFSDGGLQKVYKQVVAWKLSLDAESPEVTVLSTEGSWIVLLKPRSSYKETVRSVLITVEMLHFVRRNPTAPEEQMWGRLHKVFGNYEIRPSVDDFRNHVRLIKLFAESDQAIAKSQTLQLFLSENTVEKSDKIAQNTAENIDKVDQNTMEMIDKAEKNTVEKIDMVGSDDMEVKHPFIADRDKREELVEDGTKHESCNDDDETDEEEDLFDSICAICDNGGELLCCEGSCMRSFHAKIGDGEDSYCATLGYKKAELEAIKNFLCKNCEYKQHQCFVCGVLEPSYGPNAKVFLCNNATCGHFYHPKCVTQKLHPNNRNEALQLEKSIAAGFSFTCPVHWCFECKGLEDRTQEPLQFAVCRRCPRSYHRKCLPREISFEETDEMGIITRAWELSNRILIYCLDHDIDLDIGTPSRDHLKFPRVAKPVHSVKNKVKELAEKKRWICDDDWFDQRVKKKTKYLKEIICPEESLLECHAVANSPNQPVNKQEQELATLCLPMKGKTSESSFPVVDSETEKRVIALVEKEISSLTLDDIYRRCSIPSTHASSGRQVDKIITQGKLEHSVQAVQAALQKLEKGGTVDDAKAVCEAEVLRQITRWHNKLRVYLAPCIHGMRYTSFGRHFTKKEKLIEIVDKLHWYVQPGDMIVDFSCGPNDFSQFMKEKLEKVGKRCNFKNFDVIRPKNSFCFEKRDWMTVRPKELPHGSKLIMGLNPPFGMKARLANKFIDKALSFKPKLIILIVPKETQRLDQKQQPYDLIWEDTGSLSGRSFYLPGSFDVTDKLIDQWNVSPPPLYLWSHPDWTQKHRKIAEGRGHTTSKVVSHSKQMYCRLDDIHRQNHGEVPYERNDRYSDEKVTYMTDKVVSHSKQMDRRLDDILRQNHGEVPYEQNDRCGDEKDTCMTTDKVFSHSKQVDCRLDDIHRRNHGEVPYEQNDRCGDEKDTYMTDESVNFVVGKPERVFGLPPEKLVEVAYEETKAASGRGGTFQANQSGIHLEERAAHSDSRVDRYNDKKEEREGSNCSRWRTKAVSGRGGTFQANQSGIHLKERAAHCDSRVDRYNDKKEEKEVSNCSRWRTELKRTGDAAKADSNMSISPSDSRNLQYKSRSDAPHMSNEYSSEKVAHQDNYISDPVEKVPYEDYIRNVAEYGVASVEKHLADILIGDYVGGPKSSFYTKASGESSGSFYSSENLQENGVGPVPRNAVSGRNVGDVRMYGHIRDDHTQTATASADVRAQVRTYGGHTGDGHPPTATNPPANHIRSQLRMYGRQRTHTSGYSDRQFVRTAPYGGISSLDSMGRSAMDWYTPRAHETNYTASQFNVPDNRRDMAPSPLGFGSRQQYPYRHPGSSGGWPG